MSGVSAGTVVEGCTDVGLNPEMLDTQMVVSMK